MGKKTGANARSDAERRQQRQALVSTIAAREGADGTCVVANYSELGRSVGISDVNSYYDLTWLTAKRYIWRDGSIVTLTEKGREFIATVSSSDDAEPDISQAAVGANSTATPVVATTAVALSPVAERGVAPPLSEVLPAPTDDPADLAWLRERFAGGEARLDHLRGVLAEAYRGRIAALAAEEAALLTELAALGIELTAKIGPLRVAPVPPRASAHFIVTLADALDAPPVVDDDSGAATLKTDNKVEAEVMAEVGAQVFAAPITGSTTASLPTAVNITASDAPDEPAFPLTSREIGYIAASYAADPAQRRAAAGSGGVMCRAYLSEGCNNPSLAGCAGCERHLTGAEGLQYKTATYAGEDAATDFAHFGEGAAKLTTKEINALGDHHLRRDTRLEMVVRKVPDLYRQLYCTAWRELASTSEVMVVDITSP